MSSDRAMQRGFRSLAGVPPTGWPDFETARAGLARLQGERRELNAKLEQLTDERAQAVSADQEALATAIAKGSKSEPKPAGVEAVDARIAEAQRRAGALELAVQRAEEEIEVVVTQARPARAVADAKRIEAARERVRQAVDAYLASRHELAAELALVRYLGDFPRESFRPIDPPLVGLVGRNGEPFPWSVVEEALRDDCESPAPKRSPLVGMPTVGSLRVGDSDGATRLLRPRQPNAPIRPAA